MSLKNFFSQAIKNIPGWSTKRKILVIEADDYGSIYMPSRSVYEVLSKFDSSILESDYCKYDSLESQTDLEALLEILSCFTDINEQSVKLTPFFNPANPDVDSIEGFGIEKYKYFDYSESQLLVYGNNDIDRVWKNGIQAKMLHPQYHGREHVNVPLLMQLLKESIKYKKYFDKGFYHPNVIEFPYHQSLRAAFFFRNLKEKDYLKKAIKDGVKLFKNYFNYTPRVFCPSNGVFHDDFKTTLRSCGIKAIVESGVRKIPDGRGGQSTKRKFIIGKFENKYQTLRYSRNVVFEPYKFGLHKAVKKALSTMEHVYMWNKPAVVATHRVNFSGQFSEKNRKSGLTALKMFISKAQERWPELEFMHSTELVNVILKGKQGENE